MNKLINQRIVFNFLLIQVLMNLVYKVTFKTGILNDFEIVQQIINNNLSAKNFSIDAPIYYLIPSMLKISSFDNYLLFLYLSSQIFIYLICVNLDYLGNISSIIFFSGWVVTISWFIGYPDVISIFLITLIMKKILNDQITITTLLFLIFLIFNHYALAIFISLIFILLAENHQKKPLIIYTILGFLIGRSFVQLFLTNINFQGRSRLRFIFNDGVLENAVSLTSNNFIYLIISGSLGLTILFLVFSYFEKFTINRNIYMSYFVALIGTSLSLDTSRIFSILIVPILIFILFRFDKVIKFEQKFKNLSYFLIAIFSVSIGENHVYGNIYYDSPNSYEPNVYNLLSNLVNNLMKNIWP